MLVDELASGTDPAEGAALAQAVLAQLARQARLTVVTTHFPELKEWASATDGAANAATAFDPETHAPLYRIVLGRPGTSYALQTAERLGLDESVVADARGRVAPERLRIAELLAEAETAERARGREREAAAREREQVRRLGEQASGARTLSRRVAEVRASAAQAREQAIAEAERDLTERAPSSRGCARRSAPRAAASARRYVTRPPRRPRRERARPPPQRGVGARHANRGSAARAARAAAADRAARGRRPRRGSGARPPRHRSRRSTATRRR